MNSSFYYFPDKHARAYCLPWSAASAMLASARILLRYAELVGRSQPAGLSTRSGFGCLSATHRHVASNNGRLRDQHRSDQDQHEVYVRVKPFSPYPAVEVSAQEYRRHDRRYRAGKRFELVGTDHTVPGVTDHAYQPGDQKIRLQRSPEAAGIPLPQVPVHHQRRPVHAVGPAENSGQETANEQPPLAILFKPIAFFTEQRVQRVRNDNGPEQDLDQDFVAVKEQCKPYRNTQCRKQDQPRRTTELHPVMVLDQNHHRNQNRHHHGQRHGFRHGQEHAQQGYGDQRLPESECGPEQRRRKSNGQDQ